MKVRMVATKKNHFPQYMQYVYSCSKRQSMHCKRFTSDFAKVFCNCHTVTRN